MSHCLFKYQHFLKFKMIIIFQVKKLDTLNWNCLGGQLRLSTASFDLNCSFSN